MQIRIGPTDSFRNCLENKYTRPSSKMFLIANGNVMTITRIASTVTNVSRRNLKLLTSGAKSPPEAMARTLLPDSLSGPPELFLFWRGILQKFFHCLCQVLFLFFRFCFWINGLAGGARPHQFFFFRGVPFQIQMSHTDLLSRS